MDKYIKTASVLYVEDEEKVRDGYSRLLDRCAKELFVGSNGEEGLELFKQHSPDIVVSDIKMPKMNGIDMVRAIKEINPDAYIIFTTAHNESEYLLGAIELQAYCYLLKPVPSKLLKENILSISKGIMLERINISQQEQIREQNSLLQHILNVENNISIVSNCNEISFANNSFLDFFCIEDVGQFYKRYPTLLDAFNNEAGCLHKGLVTNGASMEGKQLAKGFYDCFQSTIDERRVVSMRNCLSEPKYYFLDISVMDSDKYTYLFTLTDITKIAIQKTEALEKANHDYLTGAYNRNKFEYVVDCEIVRAKRYGTYFSIAIFDIDYFKELNDSYGHVVGDEILKMLVSEVISNTRETDLFARWGGDEFVAIFIGTNAGDAVRAADNLRKLIEGQRHNIAGNVTVSVGVTQYTDADNKDALLKRCDVALYSAKNDGRNRVKLL